MAVREDPERVRDDGVVHLVGHHRRIDPCLHRCSGEALNGLDVILGLPRCQGSRHVADRLVDAGVDEPGGEHGDADRALEHRELVVEPLGQAHDGELRGQVRPHPGHPPESCQGGRVHDMALALLQEEREEDVHAVDDAVEVHTVHPAPELHGRSDDRSATDTRVVEDDVRGAEHLERRVAQRFDVSQLRHVAVDADDLSTVGAEVGHGVVERSLLDVPEHEPRASLGEPLRRREPDPARAARDDRRPALHVHVTSSETQSIAGLASRAEAPGGRGGPAPVPQPAQRGPRTSLRPRCRGRRP